MPTIASTTPTTPRSISLKNSANQSINNTTWTALTFDTEQFKNNLTHSTSVNPQDVTIPEAGVYLLTVVVDFAAGIAVTSVIDVGWGKNNSVVDAIHEGSGVAGASEIVSAAFLVSLAVGDTVQAFVYHNAGSAQNALANACFFQVAKIS